MFIVLAGAGCFGQKQSVPPRRQSASAVNTDISGQAAAKVYNVGEEAAAGDIVHKIQTVEVMNIIPASATLPKWELIAEDLPAAEDWQWVYITGEVTNNSKTTQTLDSTAVVVKDEADNEFSVSTDTTIYVDSNKSPIYLTIQPTQTISWEGYWQVPAAASKLQLKATDLDFFSEKYVLIDLGL